MLASVLPISVGATAAPPPYLTVAALAVAGLVGLRSVRPVSNMLSQQQVMNTSFDRLHLVNTYGAFGSITKTRYQLVVEGTQASHPDEDDWREYRFKGQPVRPNERPPQWAPYHLRLDWQLWFAAMQPRPKTRQKWLLPFLVHLMKGDDATLGLLRHTPFSDEPPEQVRVVRYRYRYTAPEERADTGDWWVRERVGVYFPLLSREELRQGTVPSRGRYV